MNHRPRQVELDEIAELIRHDRVRLVTLTGPGGIGKLRLATQVAVDVRESFPGGVWFVPLAALTSSQEVPAAIAQVIGATESETVSAATAVLQQMQDVRALVVLDNFEHVMSATAFVSQLLAAAPDVTVLATSREPLRASAEHVYPIPAMAVGRADDPVEALASTDAVALFVDRARARDNTFSLDPNNAGAIVEICRRLDGLPLAIELAAARVSALGTAGPLDRCGKASWSSAAALTTHLIVTGRWTRRSHGRSTCSTTASSRYSERSRYSLGASTQTPQAQ